MHTLDRPGLEQARGGIALQAYVPDALPGSSDQRLGATAGRGGRRTDHDSHRQRCQYGNGARRGVVARLAAGALQRQARHRRQFQTHAARSDAAREPRRGSPRRRIAQPVRTCLRTGACSRANDVSTGCNSKCSKAWPTTSVARSSSWPKTCALRPGLAQGGLHPRHRLSVRRLDENTGPDNFLRHAFKLESTRRLEATGAAVLRVVGAIDETPVEPRRTQDRASTARVGYDANDTADPSLTSRIPISAWRRTSSGPRHY